MVIIVKDKRDTIKVKNLETKQESEVRREELMDHVHAMLHDVPSADRLNVRRERTISSSTDLSKTEDHHHGYTSTVQDSMHVTVLTPSRQSGKLKDAKRRQIVEKAVKSVAPFVEMIAGAASSRSQHLSVPSTSAQRKIEIVAVDLRMPALRKFTACSNWTDDDTFRKDVLDPFAGQRDVLVGLRQHLLEMKRNRGTSAKWVFVYSYVDDAWEIFKF
jgi:hypothetical protein